MLKIENLSTSYDVLGNKINILDNINFTINENEIFGIAGESGSGKTTLLKVLYDIITPPLNIDSGKVSLEIKKDGQVLNFETGAIRDTWWKHISYIPQGAQSVLNPVARLEGQFLDSVPKEKLKGKAKQETLDNIKKYMQELNLSPDLLNAFPFQLSGGMRQRVIIALATFMHPRLILADEPTTALDVVVQKSILKSLMRLQKQFKNTIVFVSHDMGVHYQITHRMGIMYAGKLVEIGKTEKIFENPVHPYTQMLVDALPRVGDATQRKGISGRPPSMLNMPKGCRFAERCPKATDLCREKSPELKELKDGHFAACFVTAGGEALG